MTSLLTVCRHHDCPWYETSLTTLIEMMSLSELELSFSLYIKCHAHGWLNINGVGARRWPGWALPNGAVGQAKPQPLRTGGNGRTQCAIRRQMGCHGVRVQDFAPGPPALPSVNTLCLGVCKYSIVNVIKYMHRPNA